MEDHAQVLSYAIGDRVEVPLREFVGRSIRIDNPVQAVPDHEGSPAGRVDFLPEAGVLGTVFCQQAPLAGPADEVEIPGACRWEACLDGGHDRQSPTLRERRGLQAEAEPTEVLCAPSVQRIGRSGAHRFPKNFLGHARAVVQDGDPGVMPVPAELHIDVRRVGGDAVVYEVGDGCLRVVPEGPQGLNECACPRFNNLETI